MNANPNPNGHRSRTTQNIIERWSRRIEVVEFANGQVDPL